MKQGWEIKKLGEVCYFQNGFAFKSNTFTDRGEPILRISDIQNDEIIESKMVFFNPKSYPEDLSRFLVYPNDIVIAMSGGTTGKIGINKTNKTFYLNQRVGVFRENPNLLNHQYLYYFLKTKSEESLNLAAGAAQPNLSTVQINAFEIPTPSLAEQERIVGILDKEFERIDVLKANAEQNLQHAKDLFSMSLKTLFDGEKLTLGEVLNLRRGYDLTHNEMNGGDVPVAGSGGIIGYHNIVTPITPCITVGRSGSVGKVYIYEKCWAHNTVLYVDDFKGNNPYYLTYLLISLDLSNKKSGCGVPTLNRNYLHPIRIGFNSSIEEQNAIVARLDKLKEHCKALEENYTKTIALCDDMKQALLRKAFNGEL